MDLIDSRFKFAEPKSNMKLCKSILMVIVLPLTVIFNCASATTGTGFMVAPGLIITNDHVISECGRIEIVANDGRRPATLVDAESTIDLALLRVYGLPKNFAKVRSEFPLELGEQVMVFGFPLSGALSSTGNFTIGNVSSLRGLRDAAGQIQITAPVQPGNSGGPIIDTKGQVVGVVRSKLDALKTARSIGDIPQNVNFGISLSVLVDFLEKNRVPFQTGYRESSKSAVEVAKIAQTFTYLVQCLNPQSINNVTEQNRQKPIIPSVGNRDSGKDKRLPNGSTRDASYFYAPAPTYPESALASKAEGTVMLRVEVLFNGLAGSIQVVDTSGSAILDRHALQTVKKWKFNPALLNGVEVVQWVTVPITYRLVKK